jgi:hypothetical protein
MMETDIISVPEPDGRKIFGKLLDKHLTRTKAALEAGDPELLRPARFLNGNALIQRLEDRKVYFLDTECLQSTANIAFLRCRDCDDHFEFQIREDVKVKVFAGLPDRKPYRAVSYVWGATSMQEIACLHCKKLTKMPLSSPEKLRTLLRTAQDGDWLWIDTASIDQTNPIDVKRQVAVMGNIYKNAQAALVVFPESDRGLFNILVDLCECAWLLLSNKPSFLDNEEKDVKTSVGTKYTLAEICIGFLRYLNQFNDLSKQSCYFERAWTFQEWSLAMDLDITHENPMAGLIRCAKSQVIDAAALICRYIVIYNDLAVIATRIPRGEIVSQIEIVKQLFPHEDFFLSWNEVDEEEKRFQTLSPSMGVDEYLGIRPVGALRADNLKTRLYMMLNGFDFQKRKARYAADLVASWASMLNIEYAYDKDDGLPLALHKVTIRLRELGIQIWKYHLTNIGAILSSDTTLLHYTRELTQANANNEACILGAPAFTGQVDTAYFVGMCLVQTVVSALGYYQLPESAGRHSIRVVRLSDNIKVEEQTNCKDLGRFEEVFSKVIYGKLVQDHNFTPTLDSVRYIWNQCNSQLPTLSRAVLYRVAIPVTDAGALSTTSSFNAWTIAALHNPDWTYFVGRECMNGSLILFAEKGERLWPMGYLCFTDQICGTFIVRTDNSGRFEVLLRTPLRGDRVHHDDVVDRYVRCTIPIAQGSICYDI